MRGTLIPEVGAGEVGTEAPGEVSGGGEEEAEERLENSRRGEVENTHVSLQ